MSSIQQRAELQAQVRKITIDVARIEEGAQ